MTVEAEATTTATAERLANDALLRCWLRERGSLPFDAEIEYESPTGWHRFAPLGSAPADVALRLAASAGSSSEASEDLVARVRESTRRIADHLNWQPTPVATPFLEAEQQLLAGHPFHPTPKSRDDLDEAEAAAYSPELGGSFALHWFAADAEVVSHDSALEQSAPDLVKPLAPPTEAGWIAIPAHPWQARDLIDRPGIRALLDAGRLRHLGPHGPAWYPTSSLRTVYRPDADFMLKLSLGLRVTNSKRENLRKELLRGTEMHRLLESGLDLAIATVHPRFRVLTDPAWIAVDAPGDRPECGLELTLRTSPFGNRRVVCVGALTDLGDRPIKLAQIVRQIAENEGRDPLVIALEWLVRYLEVLVIPILWLDAEYGITLEAHQQNTLLGLDETGWPEAGWYRDNQGFYFRESAAERLRELLPEAGEASDTIVPDDVVTERLAYYLGINNLLGVIGAMGYAGLVDERIALRTVRDHLAHFAPSRHAVTELLLSSPTLRSKANLLTRLGCLDELLEPLATQSVYVEIRNPLDLCSYETRETAS